MRAKKMNYFILWFSWILVLHADWNPLSCFPEQDLDRLQEPLFINLKREVVRYLEGSWCSAEKINLMMDLLCVIEPALCVEIGAFTGSSVLPVASTLKHLQVGRVIAIDAWSSLEAIKNLDFDDPNRPHWAAMDMKNAYLKFQTMLWEHFLTPYCVTLCLPSNVAARYVNEIDFLNLDGDYSERGSMEDVKLYLPKVKRGGYILLSNLYTMVNGKAPKMKSFAVLYDACELICEIERGNAILFRKL